MNRISPLEAGFAIAALCFLSLLVLIITAPEPIIIAPEPKNCKQTGAELQVTSFILVGRVIVPHTYSVPVYDCSEKNTNDQT